MNDNIRVVRAVSNKIVSPSEGSASSSVEPECFDGRMLKHMSGQGPIYIRATKDISSALFRGKWAKLQDDSSDSDESDDVTGLDGSYNCSVSVPSPDPV